MKRSIDVTLHTQCPTCRRQLSVSSLSMSVPCWSCDDVLEIGVAGWHQLLAQPLASPSLLEVEGTGEVELRVDRHQVTVAYGVWEPFCPECTEPIQVAAGAAGCRCPSAECGAHISFVTPSAEQRTVLPVWITHLIETPVAQPRRGGNATAYDCPHCRAPLPLSAGRIAKCAFCQTESRLPLDEAGDQGPLGALQLAYDV